MNLVWVVNLILKKQSKREKIKNAYLLSLKEMENFIDIINKAYIMITEVVINIEGIVNSQLDDLKYYNDSVIENFKNLRDGIRNEWTSNSI